MPTTGGDLFQVRFDFQFLNLENIFLSVYRFQRFLSRYLVKLKGTA
jgi:hypothetical protein